jgi:carbonic anhydrase/acetyltransferase-like protein (isoleucine patch superfamily)
MMMSGLDMITIMSGVHIGQGTVVAAGAELTDKKQLRWMSKINLEERQL